MDHPIAEKSINRPGLALTGFFKYFALRRIQVFGLAELTYLKSLSAQEQQERLRMFCQKQVPAIVVTRHRHPPEVLLEQAGKYGVPVFRTPMITNDFINACTVIIEDLTAPRMRTQGTMLEIEGIGVLLRGKPGIGKSEAALALIERGHSLVSDDVTELRRDSITRTILGSASEMTRYHMEIRGVGIVHVPSLFGISAIRGEKTVELVIELRPMGPEFEVFRNGEAQEFVELLGEQVPLIKLPVTAGRDMANIIEVACLNTKLKGLGHDAAKELDEKMMSRLRHHIG